jgi:hypothetical protein
VQALAADEVAQFDELAADAWQTARDYEEKTHGLAATTLQIETEYDAKLRALCGSLPGETTPDITSCGEHGGQIADLRAAVAAAGLRIRHAAQASANNQHAIAVEEERFGKEVAITLNLAAEIEAAHGQIFQIKEEAGQSRSVLVQAEAMAECRRIKDNMRVQADELATSCTTHVHRADRIRARRSSGSRPRTSPASWRPSPSVTPRSARLKNVADNQCESDQGQAGLQNDLDELQRGEEAEIIAVNAEIDAAIRSSELEIHRAASVALVKNIRAEGLLLEIEAEEAELARSTAMTSMHSAYQEVAALVQARARAVGLLVEDSPDNALTRPHFLAARLEAAGRVLPARERTIRRTYLALRALEYELNQELPALRDELAAARSPEDIAGVMNCLAGIAEDYRLEQGYGQPYVTEVSLRADIFGMTADVPDVDGSPATPAEQFAALLQDPLHRQADGGVALPFALSAFEHALFSSWLCSDRIDQIEVKLVGDYLGDKEAEVLLTRQGLAGVRRCDGADLPQWSAYVSYEFEREQISIQAGVNDWGTGGPNAGYAAWPVHGEQWTLTIPPPARRPRTWTWTSGTSPTSCCASATAPARSRRTALAPSHRAAGDTMPAKCITPPPFLFYPDGERIFYLSPGPAVLLFAIAFKDIVRNNLISEQPVMQPTKHPFASVTGSARSPTMSCAAPSQRPRSSKRTAPTRTRCSCGPTSVTTSPNDSMKEKTSKRCWRPRGGCPARRLPPRESGPTQARRAS